jgi:hypothetical protein
LTSFLLLPLPLLQLQQQQKNNVIQLQNREREKQSTTRGMLEELGDALSSSQKDATKNTRRRNNKAKLMTQSRAKTTKLRKPLVRTKI